MSELKTTWEIAKKREISSTQEYLHFKNSTNEL